MSLFSQFKVVIPARYDSSRLPGKPLLDIAGKPMIEHVYRRALASGAEEVVIATDDSRIEHAAQAFRAKVCMTAVEHQSGTDRIAEVARIMEWGPDEIIVNLQGDEPLMEPELIRQVGQDLFNSTEAQITTICAPIQTTAELFDPHVVKVVLDSSGNAMYFTRAPVPWDRDAFAVTTEELPEKSCHYRHIGLYAYRAAFLLHYAELEPCYLEKTESLEQLRAMWHGARIHVSVTDHLPPPGVDTPRDLEHVASLLRDR